MAAWLWWSANAPQCVPVDDRDGVPASRRTKNDPRRVSWQAGRESLLFQPHVSSTRAVARWSTRAARAFGAQSLSTASKSYTLFPPTVRSISDASRCSCATSSSRDPHCARIPAVVNMEDAGFRYGDAPPTAPRQQNFMSFDPALTPPHLYLSLQSFTFAHTHTKSTFRLHDGAVMTISAREVCVSSLVVDSCCECM